MVVQFDEGLPDFFFGDADELPHQEHERKKDFCNQAPELLRQEDILSPHDGKDKEETAGDHEEDQNTQGKAENQGKRRMNIFQTHDGNIPEQKDESEENDTGKDEQSDENSLLRLYLQRHPLINLNTHGCYVNFNKFRSLFPQKFVRCFHKKWLSNNLRSVPALSFDISDGRVDIMKEKHEVLFHLCPSEFETFLEEALEEGFFERARRSSRDFFLGGPVTLPGILGNLFI